MGKFPDIVEKRERRTLPNPIPREDPLSLPPRIEDNPLSLPPRDDDSVRLRHGKTVIAARGTSALILLGFAAAGAGGFLAGRYLTPLTGGEQVLEARLTALAAETVRHKAAHDAELEALKLELRSQRDQLRFEHAATEYNLQLIAGSLRPAGIKLEWEDGTKVPELDLHPAPLRVGKAPPIQPIAALKRAPSPAP